MGGEVECEGGAQATGRPHNRRDFGRAEPFPKAGGYTLRGRESLGLKAALARTVPATTNRRISLPHNPAGVEEWAAGGIRRAGGGEERRFNVPEQ